MEAAGSQFRLDLALRLAAEKAVVSIFGYHETDGRTVDMQAWNWKGLTSTNAHVDNGHQFAVTTVDTMPLLETGRPNIASSDDS